MSRSRKPNEMECICGHGDRAHPKTAPYACVYCDCRRFRWDLLDWTSRALRLWDDVDAGVRAA